MSTKLSKISNAINACNYEILMFTEMGLGHDILDSELNDDILFLYKIVHGSVASSTFLFLLDLNFLTRIIRNRNNRQTKLFRIPRCRKILYSNIVLVRITRSGSLVFKNIDLFYQSVNEVKKLALQFYYDKQL